MNTLIKPISQKSFGSSVYLKPLSGEHHIECEYNHSLNGTFQTAGAVQESAPAKSKHSPVGRRPLPPAKPPMRL